MFSPYSSKTARANSSKALCTTFVMLIGTYGSTVAQAQTSPLNTIYTCASITNNTDRLACFDKHVPILQVKEEKKEIITLDAKAVKKIESDSYGFSQPSIPTLGTSKLGTSKQDTKKSKKAIQIYAVKSVSPSRKGVTVVMKNGQVWKQINGEIGNIPKGPLTAKIKPASVGTYFISLKNEKGNGSRKGARFKRIE